MATTDTDPHGALAALWRARVVVAASPARAVAGDAA